MLDPPDTEEDTETEQPAVSDTEAPVTTAPDIEVSTDALTQPGSPIETAPATGDDTVIYIAVCALSLGLMLWLVISKILKKRRF